MPPSTPLPLVPIASVHWTFPDKPPDAPPGEWAACVANVVKGGEYTPEADGPRAYAVKMAARLYVHWAFRVRHYVSALAREQATGVVTVAATVNDAADRLAFCRDQQAHARARIDASDADLHADVEEEIRVYYAKDTWWGKAVPDPSDDVGWEVVRVEETEGGTKGMEKHKRDGGSP